MLFNFPNKSLTQTSAQQFIINKCNTTITKGNPSSMDLLRNAPVQIIAQSRLPLD